MVAHFGVTGSGAGLERKSEGVLVGLEAQGRHCIVELDCFGGLVCVGEASDDGVVEGVVLRGEEVEGDEMGVDLAEGVEVELAWR